MAGPVKVPLDSIPVGVVCRADLHDEQGLLLLGKGQRISQSVIDQFRGRGIAFVLVGADDANSLLGRAKDRKKPEEPVVESAKQRRVDRSRETYSRERSERFTKRASGIIDVVAGVGKRVRSLSQSHVTEIAEIPRSLVEMLLEDADQSIAILTQSYRGISLPSRCALMSLLTINSGIELDLADDDIAQIGIAALIHDLGMYLLPDHIREPTTTLSENDAWDYRRHPALTMELFAKFGVSDEACLIASQVHEKPDGTGYPRGLHINLIHPHANILSLVDAYLMLTSPGPGRPAVVPHDAICFLLHEGGRGRFEVATVKAFLNLLTLFPISSQVELDGEVTATVIRRDGDHYHAPIVKLDGPADQVIVLADGSHKISRPVMQESNKQMRITAELMETLTMDMLSPV